jgi:hypothetical protein
MKNETDETNELDIIPYIEFDQNFFKIAINDYLSGRQSSSYVG